MLPTKISRVHTLRASIELVLPSKQRGGAKPDDTRCGDVFNADFTETRSALFDGSGRDDPCTLSAAVRRHTINLLLETCFPVKINAMHESRSCEKATSLYWWRQKLDRHRLCESGRAVIFKAPNTAKIGRRRVQRRVRWPCDAADTSQGESYSHNYGPTPANLRPIACEEATVVVLCISRSSHSKASPSTHPRRPTYQFPLVRPRFCTPLSARSNAAGLRQGKGVQKQRVELAYLDGGSSEKVHHRRMIDQRAEPHG